MTEITKKVLNIFEWKQLNVRLLLDFILKEKINWSARIILLNELQEKNMITKKEVEEILSQLKRVNTFKTLADPKETNVWMIVI